jgi:hypothetical protein
MAILDRIKQILGTAIEDVKHVGKAESALREALAALERDEQALLGRPAPPDEVVATLAVLVTDLGQKWRAEHGAAVVAAASGHIARAGGPVEQRAADTLRAGALADVLSAGPLSLAALAGLVPDLVIRGLTEVVRGTDYAPGAPMADRLARLGALQKERDTLEREHASLVDRAAASGISIPLLPVEHARRIALARRRESWELDTRMNRAFYERNPNAKPAEPQ